MRLLFMLNYGFDTNGPSLHLYKALFEDLLKAGHTVHLLESVSILSFRTALNTIRISRMN